MKSIAEVEITHPEKILFPEYDITKLDIAKYYEKVAAKILPYLKDRPVSLVRAPEGIAEPKFYQKHPSENFPEYIERVKIKEKEGDGVYITIDSLNDIIYLVNIGVIEFHVWGSKYPNLDKPDTLVFDLDPSSESKWEDVIEAAFLIKEKLEKDGYQPQVKTSGVKGYHVIVYNVQFKMQNWVTLKSYTKSIAQLLVEKDPTKFTIDLPKVKRKGKVFIDYLRNSRGATNACMYSVRAFKNATVSFPISWDDVKNGVKPYEYNINSLLPITHSNSS